VRTSHGHGRHRRHGRVLEAAAALVPPLAALWIQSAFWDLFQPYAWSLFFAAVVASSWIGGQRAGLVATFVSTGLVLWFFPTKLVPAVAFTATGVLFSLSFKRLSRRTEAQLKAFIEQAPISMAILDRNMTYLATSHRWVEDYGRGRRDLVGLNHYDAHPDLPVRWRTVHRQALAGASLKSDEDLWVQADGSENWARWAVLPWFDADGAIGGIIISAENITERKRAERALKADLDAMTRLHDVASRFLLEGRSLDSTLAEILDAAIAISGADRGSIQIVDPASSDLRMVACRGFPSWWLDHWNAVSTGRGTCGTALDRMERVIVEDVEDSAIFAGTPALEIQRKAGVRAVQSTPLFTMEGKPIGVFSTHYEKPHRPDEHTLRLLDLLARQAADIIDRARAADALAASEQKYADIFRTSPIALVLTRLPDRVMVDVNEAFLSLFEVRREEVLGKTTVDLGISEASASAEVVEALRAHGPLRSYECVRKTKSGALRALSLNVDGLEIEGVPYALTAALDITARVQVEEERKRNEELVRLEERLTHAVQSRDEVLGIVAHDLRNPLNAIMLSAARLRRSRAEPERRSAKPAETIERAATRMDRLIGDLVDITRIDAGQLSVELTSTPAGELVSASVEVEKSLAAAASIELRLALAADVPPVHADRDRLLQVLENLVGNAIKFTTPGGVVTVGAAPNAGDVRFWVEDTGSGILPENLPHVFDRFWQARPAGRKGAGLGLAIAKGIVEAHGGRIWAESHGRGSVFAFTIPAERPVGVHP
jgi:PAS domain S-box-containing protein